MSDETDPYVNSWPFKEGTIIRFQVPMQGDLYAEVCSYVGTESVKWWHPNSKDHYLGALEGRLFLEGIKECESYHIVKRDVEEEVDSNG